METLLRKYLWAIDLAVIGLCMVFVARATDTYFIESALATRGTPAASRRAHIAPRPTTTTVYAKMTEEILKRNIFCSTCPPILETPTTQSSEPVVPPLQKTSLPLKLLAVMYAPTAPEWSMAIIRDTEEKSAGPYGVNSKIRDATITSIEESRVYLLIGANRREYMDLLDRASPPPTPGVAPAPIAATTSTDPTMAALEKGIKKTGEHTYEVQRGTVDSLLGNMSMLSRAARIVPEIRDGKAAGFRLFSIRPDGPFAMIGLQNGDVISAINGLEMTSPDKALEVYTKLRSASHLSVALERNGVKITKEYNIR
jgi:general secretion pathway protein C